MMELEGHTVGSCLVPLALFLRGPDLLKGHAGLGRVNGRHQPWGQRAPPREVSPPSGGEASPS